MLTTHHEVAHVSRPKNRRRRAEQRRGDIDAERLGGLQVDARPGAIRLDVSVGSISDLGDTSKLRSSPDSGHRKTGAAGSFRANRDYGDTHSVSMHRTSLSP